MSQTYLNQNRIRSAVIYFEIWSKFWNLVELLKFGQTFEIWSKFWNLVKILKFGQNSEFLCLQILYLKIFHLKILNWICRQCVDCQVRNIDSDCLLLEKSTVTLASRLSTYWRPLNVGLAVRSCIEDQRAKFVLESFDFSRQVLKFGICLPDFCFKASDWCDHVMCGPVGCLLSNSSHWNNWIPLFFGTSAHRNRDPGPK